MKLMWVPIPNTYRCFAAECRLGRWTLRRTTGKVPHYVLRLNDRLIQHCEKLLDGKRKAEQMTNG